MIGSKFCIFVALILALLMPPIAQKAQADYAQRRRETVIAD
ncbi:MAG: hypothetical protein ACE5NM_03685 [Sedimentisphaerales bacterium]